MTPKFAQAWRETVQLQQEKLAERVDELEMWHLGMGKIVSKNPNLEIRFDALEKRVNALEEKVVSLEETNQRLEEENKALKESSSSGEGVAKRTRLAK
jgi:hypothetical protein